MNVQFNRKTMPGSADHPTIGYGPVYIARNHEADLKALSKLTHDEKMERLELAAAKAGVKHNPTYTCATCGKTSHLTEVPF